MVSIACKDIGANHKSATPPRPALREDDGAIRRKNLATRIKTSEVYETSEVFCVFRRDASANKVAFGA
jgi:hypothetical protein